MILFQWVNKELKWIDLRLSDIREKETWLPYWFDSAEQSDSKLLHVPMSISKLSEGITGLGLNLSGTNQAKDITKRCSEEIHQKQMSHNFGPAFFSSKIFQSVVTLLSTDLQNYSTIPTFGSFIIKNGKTFIISKMKMENECIISRYISSTLLH